MQCKEGLPCNAKKVRNMYECEQGSNRLAIALYHRLDDEAAMQRLAYILHYEPQQLRQDVQALYDCLRKREATRDYER